jgi:hypothetical protein
MQAEQEQGLRTHWRMAIEMDMETDRRFTYRIFVRHCLYFEFKNMAAVGKN